MRVGSDDLEWLWKAAREGSMFPAEMCKYARAIWPRATNFGVVTRLGETRAPIPRRQGPVQRSQIFETPNIRPHDVTTKFR